jgi:hypothetical protein
VVSLVRIERPDLDRGVERAEPAGPRGSQGVDVPFIPNGPSQLPSDRTPDHGSTIDRAAYHAEYRATVDAVYRADAISRGCDRVRETEETTVTPAMRRIEAEDPDRCLIGLEYRLKGAERLTEKVTEVMEERGHTAEEAFAMVKDAIRYTFQYTDDGYADGVRSDCNRLKEAGFEPVDLKNSWAAEEYKGINSRWRAPENGQVFEVQFHTEASFEAKQETHGAYERLRAQPEDEDEVRQLRAYQREVCERIAIPPGAPDIQDYR